MTATISLADAVRSGDRAALARAITLIESSRPKDREAARALLDALLPATGGAFRVGITGAPGVGKSTLIDQLGVNLIAAGHRVAVLAIDPSSARSGGSILADKTRMGRLAAEPAAFIRPSPAAGVLGGGARCTREAMLLCEAAGFDVVIVETVGIGQSEAMVADLVDVFIVLIQPGAGDELQGLKKGVLESANLIAVTKADSAAEAGARTAGAYRAALNILVPADARWRVPVVEVSGLADTGLDILWSHVLEHRKVVGDALDARRREQDARSLRRLVEDRVLARYFDDPATRDRLAALEDRVRRGEITPAIAAEEMLSASDQ